MSITFHKEEIEFDLPSEEKLTAWLLDIASKEDKTISQFSYIFCSDDYLLNINKTYLNHDYYTDIITFPYKQGHEIESDIFISVDRVRDNATEYKTTFESELLRVMAHGLLHMAGYGDKTEEDQDKMTNMENQCLVMWSNTKKSQ
ncbi:MAG: putative rRNA maturation factor [Saprospiraceae bacterium]|jgi:probable rRNA maturation factor